MSDTSKLKRVVNSVEVLFVRVFSLFVEKVLLQTPELQVLH